MEYDVDFWEENFGTKGTRIEPDLLKVSGFVPVELLIWEVKSEGQGQHAAERQLAGRIQQFWDELELEVIPGPADMAKGEFLVARSGEETIAISFPADGVVHYHHLGHPDGDPSLPRKKSWFSRAVSVAGGISMVLGTLAQDVFTGGLGVADDMATIGGGISLILDGFSG
jgi:hypothetical protein